MNWSSRYGRRSACLRLTTAALGVIGAVCCTCYWSTPAAATENGAAQSTSLNWVRLLGAEACSGSIELASKIEAHLGHSVLRAQSEGDVAIEASVQPSLTGPGWTARIVMSRRDGAFLGQRVITSEEQTCSDIFETAALVIALMIDPDAVTRTQAAQPSMPAKRSPTTTSTNTRCTPHAGTDKANAPSQVEARLALVVGLLPRLSEGFSVNWRTLLPRSNLGLKFGGSYYLPRSATSEAGGASTFGAFLMNGGACIAPMEPSSVTLSGCAGLQVGGLATNGNGLSSSNRVIALLANTVADVHVDLGISTHLRLGVTATLGIPLIRDRFEVAVGSERRLVHQVSPVFAALGAGLGWEY